MRGTARLLVDGPYLQVAGGGVRSWIFRFTLNGRTRDMGLGSVATFSLAEARQAALEARKLQAAGIDPIERRKAQRAQERSREVKTVTFRQEADAYINAHRSSWKNAKHAQQWRATLETYVYPTIGDVAVADVDTGMLVRILEPIWSKKTETANRVRGRIERILDPAGRDGALLDSAAIAVGRSAAGSCGVADRIPRQCAPCQTDAAAVDRPRSCLILCRQLIVLTSELNGTLSSHVRTSWGRRPRSEGYALNAIELRTALSRSAAIAQLGAFLDFRRSS